MARAARQKRKSITDTLDRLLDELDEACTEVQGLIRKRKQYVLEGEARLDLLADLYGAVFHLHVHSKGLDDLISQEMDEVEAEDEKKRRVQHKVSGRRRGLLKKS